MARRRNVDRIPLVGSLISKTTVKKMSKELDAKLKTALDESRLLILGAQVLLGFAFQASFQELFSEIGSLGRFFHIVALCLLCLSVAFLVVPSFYHQIACNGCSLHRAVHVATSFANWSLFPLTLGLGASGYVIIARLAGPEAGFAFGAALTATALCLLYGIGLAHVNLPKLCRLRAIPRSTLK